MSAPKQLPRSSGSYLGMLFSGGLFVLILGMTVATVAAGDLLRGGYTMNRGSSANPASLTPLSESKMQANMTDALARATQAIRAVQQMQSAARSIAASAGKNNLGINPNNPSQQLPNVPNGLGVGGLEPAAGSVWTGAGQPAEVKKSGETVVTVNQTSQDATLTWTTFNIGRATTLDFNQSKTGANPDDSIVFNIIEDPSGVPSQILGSIEAQGQVYVINQNGIIFGGASQVNVHALVASSLPINTNLVSRGLLNNPDDQFLFSQIKIPAGTNGPTPAFTPPAPVNGVDGDVTVEAGAQITAPANADSTGGRVALIGPDVTNAGTISTPDGQAILAAGEQVGFLASSNDTLRGLVTYIGAVDASSGAATNKGIINVPSGDVTIAGKNVNQLGVIDSTTSVTLNGRVDLDAAYGTKVVPGENNTDLYVPTASGMVTLGPGSVTDILPDLSSPATVTGLVLALVSTINIEGETIHFATDSRVLAPDANIAVSAGGWFQTGETPAQLIPDSGQIYFDAGATIDVAGSIVSAPVSQNIVSAELLGPELADSPLQRNGVLYGQTVEVDAREKGVYDGVEWEGTPLANVSGYIGLIELPVGELTTGGGTVNLSAGASVVMQPSSEINVSGGAVNYQGGMVQTTYLLSDGHIVNIADATPNLVYQGVLGKFTVNFAKWGISESFTTPLVGGAVYQQSYTEGGNGGSITIAAPSVALDGQLVGQTAAGPRQLVVPPSPSSLTLSFQMETALETLASPTPPHVIFESGVAQPAVPAFAVNSSGDPIALPDDRQAEVILSPDLLTQDGFGSLTVNDGDGNVTVPAGVALDAPAWGSISLVAANLYIGGSITAPDGELAFTVYDYSPYAWITYPTGTAAPPANPTRGNFVLGSSASLSTAGLIVDNLQFSPSADSLPVATSGGTIAIRSYSADLAAGSTIDVSGGALGGPTDALTYGNGGAITIAAGQDPESTATLGGKLILDATLTGFSGAEGGSLSILAPGIQIGGSIATHSDTLLLAPSFFSQGGFASFSLTGLGSSTGNNSSVVPGILIAPGTVIAPMVENWLGALDPLAADGMTLSPILFPEAQRTPVSVTLNATGVKNTEGDAPLIIGDFVMGIGAEIITDPQGSVSINGGSYGTVTLLGLIDAPGGKISIAGATDSDPIFNGDTALATVYIGPNAVLSTAGTTVLTPDVYGLLTGSVLPGGTITVSGNIVAAAGSVLNVSGASGVLYLPESETTLTAQQIGSFLGTPVVPFRVDSNGGSITLAGGQELFTAATLLGAAGGPAAVGGSLTISSGIYVNQGSGSSPGPTAPTLVVTQGGETIPTPTGIGRAVLGTNGQVLSPDGEGHIAVNSFQGGGFDNVILAGTVQFQGAVSITAGGELSVGGGGVIIADGAVALAAPYVVLGLPFEGPLTPTEQAESPFAVAGIVTAPFDPTSGPGSLTITADLIDIGNLSLQGISQATFNAPNGDIRGDGTLDVAGNISMTAGQIYPATDVTFEIAACDGGAVTFHASGSRDLPLSAGGTLDVYASTIVQDGVLVAPMGTINLGWNGAAGTAPIDPITGAPVASATTITLGSQSVTSVSAADPLTGQALIIPYGSNPTGTEWIDPAGNNITAGGVPEKAINIGGAKIEDEGGSVIDIRGGGDLSSYEFVAGEGGSTDFLSPGTAWLAQSYSAGQLVSYKGVTYVALEQTTTAVPAVNQYWSAVPASYAVIPGYQAGYAPYAPFNSVVGDPGYVSANLQVGEQVYLGAGSGLAAGVYTLLPARYALLPGAYLVTPDNAAPVPGQTQPDGSNLVSGYKFNGLSNPGGLSGAVISRFEVDSQAVVLSRAQYDTFLANSFLAQSAAQNKVAAPLLPIDAGQLNFDAGSDLELQGIVEAQAPAGGGAGFVDINSSADIDITAASSGAGTQPGVLTLNSAELSSFGAANLLIGGYTTTGADGYTLTVDTANVTVEQGATLSGGDIILAANDSVTVDQGASVIAVGPSDDQALSITGNGALLRVSNDPAARIVRTGVTSTGAPATLTIGAGASLRGASVIMDSSQASNLDSSAKVDAKAVTIDSGLISIVEPDGAAGATPGGLVLSGDALQQIESHSSALSLLSYSSIDIYGTGALGTSGVGSLSLTTDEIRGFDQGGGTASFNAQTITLDGEAAAAQTSQAADGTLAFNGGTIHLGGAGLAIDPNVQLNGSVAIIAKGSGIVETASSLLVGGNLTLTAPVVTGAAGARADISSDGEVVLVGATSNTNTSGGLGANLSITGMSVADNGNITAMGGEISLVATSGNVTVGNLSATSLDAGGSTQVLLDQTKYTSGGTITLTANEGSVDVAADATLDVAAQTGGGNAGTLAIHTPQSSVSLLGTLLGQGGTGGKNGTFSLDTGSIPGGDLESMASILDAGGFTQSLSIRDRDDSLITVEGVVTAQTFNLSLDSGSITVTGMIDASGVTGGTINLIASGSVTLENGAVLTVSGQTFNSAGQGGSVSLQAGAYTGGSIVNQALSAGPQVDIEAGSTIDLSVAANGNAAAIAANEALGEFSGKLLISAPQALGDTDLQVQPIDGMIKNASSIIVEGIQVFDATDGSIDDQEPNVLANGNTFAGVAGAPATASYTAMVDRLFANNMGLITASGGAPAVAVIEPGAEIVNRNGSLTLANDWDLSTFRFGPDSAAGVLTLRASGSLVFDGALSDGFNASPGSLWEAALLTQNTLLPVNVQDWSYNLTAGADFSGANVEDVLPASSLGGAGSLELGINDPEPVTNNPGPDGNTASAVVGYYQVIRTGAGNIDISAGGNVELLNQFATIYTAGTQLTTDETDMGGAFSVPVLDESKNFREGLGTGASASPYPAQYSEAGGNVTILAQGDIEHLTQDVNGNQVMDSESEFPNNWLYRRGDVAASGLFGSNSVIRGGGDPSESTTWWVDFSNFFEGVGALGGGNVAMVAGGGIANVDAVVPTNARMPGINTATGGNLAPNASSLVELGGGNLLVQAGNDINGGVYYVEAGQGTLFAGNQILTNGTRAPVGGISAASGATTAPSEAWLPTTLFVGNASFDVTAGGGVLLGPVANAFMLPEGLANSIWYKSYFSTYATSDVIDVTSLGGSITFRETANTPEADGPILQVWLQNMDLLSANYIIPRSYYQPWLLLNETSMEPFSTVANLMPSTLLATAFSGDINVVGSILLSPSPTGTIDLAASGSINGFQSLGPNPDITKWTAATIDLSDSDPSAIPGIASPLGYQSVPGVGTVAAQAGKTGLSSNFLAVFSNLFNATNEGTPGVVETEQELHDSNILHVDDSTPVELDAVTGDISGLTLYSPTETHVVAGGDITDIAFYIQNDNANAVSVVSAGGDIVAYDPSSPAREAALLQPDSLPPATSLPGDIQVAGPGTLEVLAGGSLELGGQGPGGPTNTTGNGIASIGNTVNPALPFAGADIVAAAGIGGSAGLGDSELDFTAFINQFIESPMGSTYLAELSQITSLPTPVDAGAFSRLSKSEQDLLALDVFYLTLRDAGRDHNDPASSGYGNYDAGLAAIASLFPNAGPGGDIDVTSRDIKTESGGNISLLAPNGHVTVGLNSSEGDDVTNLGIVTQDGGNISIFASGNVNVGTSRIFTLRGGNEIIWSTDGDIDAGASSKTVQSAPPTRVLVDPQSADVQTDLAGLATGGGIGVLASVVGVPAGNVDLVAPAGVVNAGEAGIRATGNLSIAAVEVLNAGNISVGGAATGLPPPVVGPNIAGLAAASSAAGAQIGASNDVTASQQSNAAEEGNTESIITVQVLGYGGGDGDDGSDSSGAQNSQAL